MGARLEVESGDGVTGKRGALKHRDMPRVGDRVLVLMRVWLQLGATASRIVSARVVTGARGLGIRRVGERYVAFPFEQSVRGVDWAFDHASEADAFRAAHAL